MTEDITNILTSELVEELSSRSDISCHDYEELLSDIDWNQITGILDNMANEDFMSYTIDRIRRNLLSVSSPKLKIRLIKAILGVEYDDQIESEISEIKKLGF